MNADGFLRDVLAAPARLERLLDAYGGGESPLAALASDLLTRRRVVLLGMGSSRFAAETAAALLRSRGVDAVAELASTGLPSAPMADVLAVGISASGATPETVEALDRHRGIGPTLAVTNDPEGELAAVADHTLPLFAGVEEGGVACLTFQATVAVLLLLAGELTGGLPDADALRPAVQSAAGLRESRGEWVEAVADAFDAAHTVYTVAPAERISSALQAALLFREGPRRAADATETGDWLHVDVYLSKRSGYRALLFAGSRFDAGVMEWAVERAATVVAAGRRLPGATLHVPVPGAEDPSVAALVETGVAELVAAELWRRGIVRGDPALAADAGAS
jgi:fructoselysine-6-P-deglycase FrlB-like protein